MGDFPIGFGRYTLLERLAVGGMAELFIATSPGEHGFEKKVVIKRLLPHLADDNTYNAMFIDEAKLTARLVHPKIAQTFELGKVDNALFIAMEYVEGIDVLALLREFAQRRRRIDPKLGAWIAHEVLDALDYAHQLPDDEGHALAVVHRDISPSNVLLSVRGDVKLVDFGIARAKDPGRAHKSKSGTLKGKYGYMSPEQVVEQQVDARSDLFSIGVVLAELLTGRRLFAAANELDVLLMVRDAKLQRFEKYGMDLDPQLADIVRKALRKQVDERWQSAAAFRDAIAEWLFEHRHRMSNKQVADVVLELRDAVAERRTLQNDGGGATAVLDDVPGGDGAGDGAGDADLAIPRAPSEEDATPVMTIEAGDSMPVISMTYDAAPEPEPPRKVAPSDLAGSLAIPPLASRGAASGGVAGGASKPRAEPAPRRARAASSIQVPSVIPPAAKLAAPRTPTPQATGRAQTPPHGAPRAQTPAHGTPRAQTPMQGSPRQTPAQGTPRTTTPVQGSTRMTPSPGTPPLTPSTRTPSGSHRPLEKPGARKPGGQYSKTPTEEREKIRTNPHAGIAPIPRGDTPPRGVPRKLSTQELDALDKAHTSQIAPLPRSLLAGLGGDIGGAGGTVEAPIADTISAAVEAIMVPGASQRPPGLTPPGSPPLTVEPMMASSMSGAISNALLIEELPILPDDSVIQSFDDLTEPPPSLRDIPLLSAEELSRKRPPTPPLLADIKEPPDDTGEFATISPLRVLFRLMTARATGLLVVAIGGIKKEIYVRDGQPEYVSSNVANELFGNYLVTKGVLSDGELAMALAMMPHYGGKLGDTLVGLGLLKPLEVFRHLTRQVRSKIIDVCTWNKGGFGWYAGRENPREAFPLDFNQFEILGAGAMAVADDVIEPWLAKSGAIKLRAARTRRVGPERFEVAGLAELFESLDGRRSVDEIVEVGAEREERLKIARMLSLLEACDLAKES